MALQKSDLIAHANGVFKHSANKVKYDNTTSGLSSTTVQDAIDDLSYASWQTEVGMKINNLYFTDADVTLTTTGATDLQTAINALTEGQVLEIQANATYDPITLPTNKAFTVRVKEGFDVKMTGQNCITILDGCRDVFIHGISFEGCTTSDTNALGSAICLDHEAVCDNIIFYNCRFSLCTGSAVMLSYHQTIGGDNYATASSYPSEFSTRVAFICNGFYASCNDATEGANLCARGVRYFWASENKIDVAGLGGRGIQLQNCVDALVEKNYIENATAGNGEGIKIDRLGSPSYYNSGDVMYNTCKNCIEGIDIDDYVNGRICRNVCYGCTNEGIVIDGDSSATITCNFCWNNDDGISLETGAVANLKMNVCYGNASNDYRMDGGQTYDASNTTDPSDTFEAADNISYDNTISGLTAKDVKSAIDEVQANITTENLWDRTGTVLSPHTPTDTLTLPLGSQAVPAISFGVSPDTGIYSINKDSIYFSLDNNTYYKFQNAYCQFGSSGSYAGAMIEIATSTNPNFCPERDDSDTGIGRAGANQLSLIAGGVEGIRINSAAAHSVAGITDYETLVTNDDDIPNKKYVDDAVSVENLWDRNSGSGYTYLSNPADKLGIGVSAPSYQIDVRAQGASDEEYLYMQGTNTGILKIGYDATHSILDFDPLGDGGSFVLRRGDAGVDVLTVDNTNLSSFSGKVTIADGSSGASAANATVRTIIESDGNTFLQLSSVEDGSSGIYFGDLNDEQYYEISETITSDELLFKHNGTTVVGMSNLNLTVNPDSGTTGFIVNGDTIPSLFAVDASSQKISTGGEAAPDCSVGGITLYQTSTGSDTLRSVTIKNSALTHTFTDEAESDTGFLVEIQGALGSMRGPNLKGFSENNVGLTCTGYALEETTETTASLGMVIVDGYKTDGGTGETGLSDDGNILAIRNGGSTTNIFKGNGAIVTNGLYNYSYSASLADDAEIALPTATAGWGFVQIGDNQEWAQFSWKADGTVNLIQNSANVVSTDTDTYLCIYDAGTGVSIKNRLGSALIVRLNIHYS